MSSVWASITTAKPSAWWGLFGIYADELFADVAAVEQAEENLWGVFEAVVDSLAVFDAACGDPLAQVGHAFAITVGVLEHEKPLDLRLFLDQLPKQPGALFEFGGIVERNLAADNNAGTDINQREDGVADWAADVVEVDVDTVGAEFLQFAEIVVGRFVIESGVEAEFVGEVGDLFIRAGNADDAATFQFRDLSHRGADRSSGAGDNDGFARLGVADIEQAEIGGQSGHAEDAQGCGNRLVARADFADFRAVGDQVFLPADHAGDHVTGGEPVVFRFDDFADRLPDHHVAESHGISIRFPLVHPPPHVGIDGEIGRLDQKLTVVEFGNRFFDEGEIGFLGSPHGAGDEGDFSVGSRHGETSKQRCRGQTLVVQKRKGDTGRTAHDSRWTMWCQSALRGELFVSLYPRKTEIESQQRNLQITWI